MAIVDPLTRISEHFILADFLGCYSVYAKGYPNVLKRDKDTAFKLANGTALCEEILEKVLDSFGPFSISYGFISQDLSEQIVKYQDPRKPSHHMWSLGAACDVCVHDWINIDADEVGNSPIALAHGIDKMCVPYSRMITYSESPYICLAASSKEIARDEPRQAFYENRFIGKPKVKPDYRQYATRQAKQRASDDLEAKGLPHGWVGAGYPTHHCGGFRAFHHIRVSDYTMVSDWLFDMKSISEGHKNIPALDNIKVEDAFASAGLVYDRMLELSGALRLSIVEGYVSRSNPSFNPELNWYGGEFQFAVIPPASMSPEELKEAVDELSEFVDLDVDDDRLVVTGETDVIISNEAW
jgi:hypothetical protein